MWANFLAVYAAVKLRGDKRVLEGNVCEVLQMELGCGALGCSCRGPKQDRTCNYKAGTKRVHCEAGAGQSVGLQQGMQQRYLQIIKVFQGALSSAAEGVCLSHTFITPCNIKEETTQCTVSDDAFIRTCAGSG